jgi:2-polyprenyl-3-methyl-5-hydroxy-6-metoxy-1,4-benzoquinol methylase
VASIRTTTPAQEAAGATPPPGFEDESIPLIDTEAVDACPVCGSTRFDRSALAYDYEMRTCRNQWQVVSCRECEHAWLNPRPARHTLHVIYPPSYYAYNYEERINPLATWGKARLDALKLRSILRHLPRTPRSYLDVGCGDGRFLKAMEARGVAPSAIHGIELSPAASLAGRGYRIHVGPVEECENVAEASLDLVTMFHVLEHVASPADVVAKIRRWLSPGGVLAVETPNSDSLDARMFKSGFWGGYHVPRHWNMFVPSTLARLLRSAGLEPIGISYQTGHAFWMYSVHHSLRYGRRPRPLLARWFDPFSSLPVLVLFTAFDKLRAALGSRTSAMLVVARRI